MIFEQQTKIKCLFMRWPYKKASHKRVLSHHRRYAIVVQMVHFHAESESLFYAFEFMCNWNVRWVKDLDKIIKNHYKFTETQRFPPKKSAKFARFVATRNQWHSLNVVLMVCHGRKDLVYVSCDAHTCNELCK